MTPPGAASTTKKALPHRVALRIKEAKRAMIQAMLSKGIFTVRAACAAANVEPNTFYGWLKADPEFAAAVREAEELQIQALEQAASSRAMGIGVRKPSDLLMIFLLNGRRPDVYRHNTKVTHAGTVSLQELILDDDQPKTKQLDHGAPGQQA